MASSASITNLSVKSQLGIVAFLKAARARYTYFYSIRNNLEVIDRDYYREVDFTQDHMRARLANRGGDATKYQDVTVPIVMPQVETFVTYMTSVFLTGEPIFGVVADPRYEDAAMQMEAIMSEQAIKGRWKAELIKFFRDAGKYSISACEIPWEKRTTPTFETDPSFSLTEAKPKQVIWAGNGIKRLDLYNTFWDTNVLPCDVAEFGEFAGYNELITRTHLKQLIANLDEDIIVQNVKPAFDSSTPLNEYYIPQLNPQALIALSTMAAGTDWFSWAGIANIAGGREDIAYKATYIKTTLYIRLLPSEFGISVPQPNTPQVWKFIIINNNVIIYAERQTNAHDMIPILFCCPNDDGLRYQTKSLATNAQPMQQVATALMNSMIHSRRRAISDRGIYNPLYIESKDINSQNPAAKIPCKPTAYAGVALNEMYYPIPFRDDQAPVLMQGINIITTMADTITGQNKAQQGQFVKGNKTLHEYDDVMGNANGRNQMAAVVIEDQFFSRAKTIIKLNILQYQGEGDIYHEQQKQLVTIDPLVLRNAVVKFKVSDGIAPSDKLMHSDAWQTAMQVIGSSPSIGPAYNIAPMFSYLMKTQGADISAFEKPPQQLQYEQAVAAWQQTVAALMKENPEIRQDQFPPQPLPQQFGIGPDGKPIAATPAQEQSSIVDKIMAMQPPNPAGAAPGS